MMNNMASTIRPGTVRTSRMRGVALIELAFIVPLMVVLTFAVLEFSLVLAQYKTVVNQVRAAARYLTTKPPGSGLTEAICLVKYGDPTVSGTACVSTTPIAPGFGSAATTVTVQDAVNATSTHRSQPTAPGDANSVVVNLVTVKVSGYPYTLSFGHMLPRLFGGVTTITFEPISTTMRQVN